MNKIIIEYYIREVYGEQREYIKDPETQLRIQQLVRQKTINKQIRNLITEITQNTIEFKETSIRS